MDAAEIKSIHSQNSSSICDASLPEAPAPVQIRVSEVSLRGVPLRELPPAEELPHQPLPGSQTTVGSSSIPGQGTNTGNTFLRACLSPARIVITLVAVILGCLGGFLHHNASMGVKLGVGVLGVCLVIFEIPNKLICRHPRQRLDSPV